MLSQKNPGKSLLKPESVEQSTNDFVHAFNNLLTAILSNISMAKMGSPPASDQYKILSEAESAVDEAKELTKQFFSSNYKAATEKTEGDIQVDVQEAFFENRKVLVIDDDKRAGVAMCKMLEHLGFKVEYVRESSAAIDHYKEVEHPFDLVVLDLMVPGKKATDTLKEIQQYDPDVKAIVCSGYLNDPIMENFREYGFRGATTKPYEISELSQVLSQVLSDSSQ